MSSMFDMPLTAKVGYDFKYVDVSFNYYYGLFKRVQFKLSQCTLFKMAFSDYIEKNKLQNWQIQVYIPF